MFIVIGKISETLVVYDFSVFHGENLAAWISTYLNTVLSD